MRFAAGCPAAGLFSDLMALLHVWLGSHLDVRLQHCIARHLLPDAQLCCQQEHAVQLGRTAVLRPLDAQKQARRQSPRFILGRYQRVPGKYPPQGER